MSTEGNIEGFMDADASNFDCGGQAPGEVNKLIENMGDSIEPIFPGKEGILVFFACDRNVAGLLNVAVLSLVSNTRPHHYYDLVVLESGLSDFQKTEISSCADNHENVSIRFIDMSLVEQAMRSDASFYIHEESHFTLTTYWRVFAPYLFPHYETAVYLDVDIVVEEDVFEIKKHSLGDNFLGACRDFVGMLVSQTNPRFIRRSVNLMALSSMADYFNAGVLLMNLAKMRAENFKDKLKNAHALLKEPHFVDQDILNTACKGRVTYIDPGWNYLEWTAFLYKHKMQLLPPDQYELYLNAKNARPRIIHYAGDIKPIKRPDIELGMIFWKYARKTCWYEKFLHDMASAASAGQVNTKMRQLTRQLNSRPASRGLRPQRLLLFMADTAYHLAAKLTPQAVKPMLRVPHQTLSRVWGKVRKRLVGWN